jgi:hypothetical protein
MKTSHPPGEIAQSIRCTLESLCEEAATAELDFVAYMIDMIIMELDDVIAESAVRH